jgi:hypothetical protein
MLHLAREGKNRCWMRKERRFDMKIRSRAKFVMVVLCAAALVPSARILPAIASGGNAGGPFLPAVTSIGPPLVRLTGTICTPGEHRSKEGLGVLHVLIGSKKLIFKLEKLQNFSDDRSEVELLQDLAGYRLVLRGPENLLRPLEGPSNVGKRMYIEGNLLVSDRILDVTETGEDMTKAG